MRCTIPDARLSLIVISSEGPNDGEEIDAARV